MSSNILPYDQNNYKESYSSAYLCAFNHGPFTSGEIDMEAAKKIKTILNEKVKSETEVISFDQEIEPSLTGGSCSAIAFRIAEVATKAIASSQESLKIALINEISTLDKVGGNCRGAAAKKARKDIRTTQAALNTISIKEAYRSEDRSNEKVKALSAYFDYRIAQSSEPIAVKDTAASQEKFSQIFEALSPGVYLVRVLQNEDNHKQEKQGHSTVYIKTESDESYYFDTQLGLYDLTKIESTKPSLIFQAMLSATVRFHVDDLKFHKITKMEI